jgi:hypothetical protein
VLLSYFKSIQNGKKIEEVHASTNGKMEQLMNVVKEAEYAKGVKDEKEKTTAALNSPLSQKV